MFKNEIVIDRLKMCFLRDNDSALWQGMSKNSDDMRIGDFDFYRCRPDGMYDGIYSVYYAQREFGTLKFDRFSDKEHKYFWLSVENHVFYANEKEAFQDLQVVFGEINNITLLDIACDMTFNPVSRIKKLIKRDDVSVVRCGVKIDDKKQELEGVGFWHPANCLRELAPTLYIMDADKRKCLVGYNKMKEIKKSGKHYIAEYYDNPKRLYRMEIKLKSDELFRYFKKYDMSPTIDMLCDKKFLKAMYDEFLFRLIHVVYKRKPIGLIDAVTALKEGYDLDVIVKNRK
ncbi:MAG: hypothetical protein II401_00135 [Bacteroidales bacterium]|nr:hypothetical protein [Bacteroidales bacterium]